MKKVLFLLFLCISVGASSYAQAKKESVKELFILVKQDSMAIKMVDAILPAMINQMQSQLKDSTIKAQSKARMAVVMESVKQILKPLTDDLINIYVKHFSQEEINALIAFYKTPAGQKYVNMTPEIQKELMGLMFQKYVPEMQKSITVKMDELKNEGK